MTKRSITMDTQRKYIEITFENYGVREEYNKIETAYQLWNLIYNIAVRLFNLVKTRENLK